MPGGPADRVGHSLARYLSRTTGAPSSVAVAGSSEALAAALRPGDVLLVEGNTKFSTAIKYLTQSTWSHSALYVGAIGSARERGADAPALVEADLTHGVIMVPVSKYRGFRTRVCRPIGLRGDDLSRVIDAAVSRLGQRYDLRNIFDLLRYLLPTPPVPTRWRRRMLALGSGDPTRAICSSLIAEAFQRVRYPILPEISTIPTDECEDCVAEILHIRHHSLFAPRDFDLSPYFEIVKTGLEDFNYQHLNWAPASPDAAEAVNA